MKIRQKFISFCFRYSFLPGLLFLLLPTILSAEVFSFSSDSLSSVIARGKEKTVLRGNAQVISDTAEMRADIIEMSGEDFRFIQCIGNIQYVDESSGLLLRCEKLFHDRETNVTRAEGQAVMEDKKNEVVLKGSIIEHREDEDITLIQIGVRILKENIAARCEFARFLREEDRVELSGVPVVYKNDDEYRATRILVDLETEEVTLEGNVTGTITSTEEKDKEEETLNEHGE